FFCRDLHVVASIAPVRLFGWLVAIIELGARECDVMLSMSGKQHVFKSRRVWECCVLATPVATQFGSEFVCLQFGQDLHRVNGVAVTPSVSEQEIVTDMNFSLCRVIPPTTSGVVVFDW